jgi:hypothetical protein
MSSGAPILLPDQFNATTCFIEGGDGSIRM